MRKLVSNCPSFRVLLLLLLPLGKMSFSVDALQSRSRQEVNNKLQCYNQQRPIKREDPIISTMGEVAKGLVDTVSNVISKIWPSKTEIPATPNPVLHDVTIDVDAMIVYDQPIENDFVEVAFASQVQTPPRKHQHAKPQASLPITIPTTSNQLDRNERRERHFI